MLMGIGVYVLGLLVVSILALLIGMVFDFDLEMGIVVVIFITALIGVYFIGEIISKEFNLI